MGAGADDPGMFFTDVPGSGKGAGGTMIRKREIYISTI
jgi:hypothetical protein